LTTNTKQQKGDATPKRSVRRQAGWTFTDEFLQEVADLARELEYRSASAFVDEAIREKMARVQQQRKNVPQK